jgi:nucleoid-associated protein YgaU
MPTVRTRPPPTTTAPRVTRPAATPSVTPAPKAAKPATPAPAPAATGRKHVVRPGDTLSSISQQYYKSRAKWRDILAANKGVLRSENDLKVGMELRIP